MKTSELINKLDKIQKDVGDLEVRLYLKDEDGYICDTHSITDVGIQNDENETIINAYIGYED